jgi:hypothetical protein
VQGEAGTGEAESYEMRHSCKVKDSGWEDAGITDVASSCLRWERPQNQWVCEVQDRLHVCHRQLAACCGCGPLVAAHDGTLAHSSTDSISQADSCTQLHNLRACFDCCIAGAAVVGTGHIKDGQQISSCSRQDGQVQSDHHP